MSNKLYVQFVTRSSRLLKSVQTVASTWGNTFVIFANSMMMILRRGSSIVMIVEFVESVVVINFSIARSAVLVIQIACVTIIHALIILCVTTAPFVTSTYLTR
uniref:RING finger and CHY zinc finger domain-containing protein 1-like n=1 Tax=Rhizophora mucronata TaxID=61149 RepID=A0A2P2LGV1_RHIMU